MKVVVAGGHGQIALRLTPLLASRGDEVVGLIRNPDHADDVRAAGAEPLVCDLEAADVEEVARAVAGADAIVYAAGAGPGSGAQRKDTMDYGGAAKLVAAARDGGPRRYVMVSAMGAVDPPGGDDVFSVYLRAKARADDELRASELDWTVVRPGGLTNDPGTGRVSVAERLPRGEISRDDVAAVLAAVLAEPASIGRSFDLIAGETPVDQAVASLAAG